MTENDAECDTVSEDVYGRLSWLAARDLGATVSELRDAPLGGLAAEAQRILEHNLARPGFAAGPTASLRIVASPIWTSVAGASIRLASLVPAGLTEYYYGERLREPATAELVVSIAAEAMARFTKQPWRLARATDGARRLYGDQRSGAPVAETVPNRTAAAMLLSSLLAESARYLHAGATSDELRTAFGLTSGDRSSLDAKLVANEAWETEQYVRAMG